MTKSIEELPQYNCMVCSTGVVLQGEFAYSPLGVCGACAEAVANLWSLAHCGEYLTWKTTQRCADTYRKKPIPESLRWAVFERDGYCCLACGSGSMLRADHIVPESTGGDATIENLQTLCQSCNSSKRTKTIDYRKVEA